jgi:catechol 2,3-dioxygenase-like lactoylglutathione lyase family enzyme
MVKPKPTNGLRHVALYAENFDACAKFYSEILGMKIVWQPDADNIYLSSGTDNLALHRPPSGFVAGKDQRLDHIGFFLSEPTEVDAWYEYLLANNVEIKAKPKDHRDGTRSCYCADPDGNVIQLIYYPIDSTS